MVASNRLAGRHEDHAVPIPDSDERVLRTAVLYGANGAGKSNLFKALRYLESVALETRPKNAGTGREAFRFGVMPDAPTAFDLQFVASGELYRFGVRIDDSRVREEWLARVDGLKERPVYERVTSNDGKVTVSIPGAGEKIRALATVGGPQNQTFLATMLATLEPSDFGHELKCAVDWFQSGLHLIRPSASLTHMGHLLSQDSDLLKFAGNFLRASSTGVDHLEVRRNKISNDEIEGSAHLRFLARSVKELYKQDGPVILDDGSGELVFDGSQVERIIVRTAHEHQPGNVVPMELAEESDGTRRLLDLIPALYDLQTIGGVYFIDEIDRSLHPMLVRNFLEHFLRSCDRSQRQLIMTTHESNLLDQELLRRDEIWFAEKDSAGATHIYSLMDFKVRNDLEIRKHYLQGRFGAVPFLGDPGRLPAETNPTA